MALFNVLIDIAARTANMEAGIKRVEKKFDELGEYAKKAGELIGIAFTAEAFKEFILGAVESGVAMEKAAQKAGESVEQFSALAYAAKQTDVSIESLSNGIKFMQKSIANSNPAIGELGIHMADLKGKTPVQQLEIFADKIAGIEDPARKTEYALRLFERAGTDLIPLMDEGSAGIRKFTDEAERMGVTISESSVQALEEANQAVTRLTSSWGAMWKTIAVGVVSFGELAGAIEKPKLKELTDQLDVLAKNRDSYLKTLDNMQSSWFTKLLNGNDLTKNMESVRKQLAATEAQMNAINDEMLKMHDGKGIKKTELPAKAQLTPKFKLNENDSTFTEFKKNLAWLDEYSKSLDDAQKLTKTSSEKMLEDWQRFDEANTLLVQQHAITQAEAALRSKEYVDKILPEVTISVHKMAKESAKAYDDMSEYARAAARGIQGVMADFLFDPFKDGLKGMLKGFVDVVRRMIAEAEAAKLAEYLFGGTKKADGSTTTGVLSGILDSLFKADGGSVSGGSSYIVGERGPELFTPGVSGFITPNHALSGGGGSASITQHLYIQSGVDADLRRAIPSMMDQAKESAVATVLDMKRRGKF